VDYDINDLYIPKDGKGDTEYQKSFSAILTIIVRDKDGKVIKKYKQKSHSPTANFILLMLPLTYYANLGHAVSITTVSGSTISYNPNTGKYNHLIIYPNNLNNYNTYLVNIMVGSGSNSNPYNAYNLNAPISNGSGTGQLLYSSPNIPTNITISGNQAYFIISQPLTNQSGGTITISEVGIITNIGIQYQYDGSINGGNVLVWYDTLSSPISIDNGQSATIYYVFIVNA
jgi:hypothetical protein